MNQYPRIRAMLNCVNCGNAKDQGLILCWPCHHNLKQRHNGGYGKRVEGFLERREESLEFRANHGIAS